MQKNGVQKFMQKFEATECLVSYHSRKKICLCCFFEQFTVRKTPACVVFSMLCIVKFGFFQVMHTT
jgi:hypothetical protein